MMKTTAYGVVSILCLLVLVACEPEGANESKSAATSAAELVGDRATGEDSESADSPAITGGESQSLQASTEVEPRDAVSDDVEPIPMEDLRLSIEVEPCDLSAGDTTTVTGSVRTVEGDPVELVEPVDYQWQAPASWRIEGEGPKVELSVPGEATEGIDIRLSIEDAVGTRVRGGAPITLAR